MEVGDNVIIGHSAAVHARKIGNNVMIGMNATVLQGAEIGDFCVIGAHTLVTTGMKIPSRSLVVGVPAEIKEGLSARSSGWVQRDRNSVYAKLVQRYKGQGF